MRSISTFLFLFIAIFGLAQKQNKADRQLMKNLKLHVQYLASDVLEGRRAGSEGEQKAVDYIIAQYESAGIQPMGVQGYLQAFPINEGKKWGSNAFLKVNQQAMEFGADFFTVSTGLNTQFKTKSTLALEEAGQVWFKDLQEVLEEQQSNPHFDIQDWIKTTSAAMSQKNAKALFLYNSGTLVDNIQFNKFDTAAALAIPVVYITKDGFKKYFNDALGTFEIEANLIVASQIRTGKNVVAYINNNAAHTVVLGAHLDHLGYNQDKNALDINNDIRNGADDNASGTAALIELAKLLQEKSSQGNEYNQNNYLIIHFSAEELGLIGSKYWLDNPTIQTNFNYMVNMDMVGRYDATKKMSLGGYGTSSKWSEIITKTPTSLLYTIDSAGTGPSDHASFYRKDMPVLFMFTGSHADYHKATDDWDKINYMGQKDILRFVQGIIKTTNSYGKLDFLKTREAAMGRSTKFTVSLGVMPDYAYTGTGLRIEGASAGKLGEKLGLKAGDILLQMGDYKFIDVMSYMTTLSKFKKGDSTFLIYKRGTEEIKVTITF
jgi:Zn-dependent M28 family amino/carboxypeptidase